MKWEQLTITANSVESSAGVLPIKTSAFLWYLYKRLLSCGNNLN